MKLFSDIRRGAKFAFSDSKWLSIVGLLVIADQLTKYVVVSEFELHESIVVIPEFFNLVYVRNFGAAFGIFAGIDSPMREIFLLSTTALALGVVFSFLGSLGPSARWAKASLALVCGGAIGNLIDRIRLGYVIDFLDFYYGQYHWPAFNVADSCICIGVGLLLVTNCSFSAQPPTEPSDFERKQ